MSKLRWHCGKFMSRIALRPEMGSIIFYDFYASLRKRLTFIDILWNVKFLRDQLKSELPLKDF